MADDPVMRFALATHTQAIKALMDYLEGAEAAGPPPQLHHARCALGGWLDDHRQRLADHPAYRRARDLHDRFHHALVEIVALVEDGQRDEALARLRANSPFARTSRQLVIAFEDLSEAIERASPPD